MLFSDWVCSRSAMHHAHTVLRSRVRRSSVVDHPLLNDGSSDHSLMVDSLSYFSFQPVLAYFYNKGRDMYYLVCGMHIKDLLLLIRTIKWQQQIFFLSVPYN